MMNPPSGELGWVGVTRNANLRTLNAIEEPENRPVVFGLDDQVRLPPQQGWENRKSFLAWILCCSDPPPAGKAGCLAAALPLCIPEGPDPGIVDHKTAPFAVDANASIALKRIHFFGATQSLGSFLAFLFWSGEPGGHAHHRFPIPAPEQQGCRIRVDQGWVLVAVVSQHRLAFAEKTLRSSSGLIWGEVALQ